jgi:methionyl-tRNA formyltransferase
MHPALLPRHRGPSAVEWAFRSGDPAIGLTIHRMADDFDTGPILAQASVPIGDDDDSSSLFAKLLPAAPGLLRRAFERVARGDPGEPQEEAAATYAGLLEDEWRTIDWGRPARAVHNQVRSWTGVLGVAQGAFGEIDGERLLITRTRLLPAEGQAGQDASPGTVLRRDGEAMVVRCGDGPIELVAWSRADPVVPDP